MDAEIVNAWEVQQDFMPAWVSQALLRGWIRPRFPMWWRDGIEVGGELAMPGDRIVQAADGSLSVSRQEQR